MKKELFLASALALSLSGCVKAENAGEGAKNSSSDETRCAQMIRARFGERGDYPRNPITPEVISLEKQVRASLLKVCREHYAVTGLYPEMTAKNR